nr:metal ABC transporter substrate-binding protein [Gottfriedia endophytica]
MSGCSQQNTKKKNDKIKIVTTFYPMYDFAKNIVGSNGDVELLIPAGTEPHDYEPSPKDMANIEEADVFVYNSDAMETWVPKLKQSVDSQNLKIVKASDGIQLIKGIAEENGGNASPVDPHVWLDPVLAKKEVENIKNGIIAADPTHKSEYEKNAAQYEAKLTDLDQLYKNTLKNAKSRVFVTQHAAFAYLANEYHLTQVPIAGLSPDQEPSPSKLGELQKYVKDHNIKTIYFEEVASPKVAKTLADATGAQTVQLSPIEGVTKEEQSKGVDYIEYMKKNLEALQLSVK